MTREEAIIYFKQCNSKIISVCKDENKYDYEKQEIISDCARKTYEANRLALEALEQEPKTGYWIKYGIPRCEEQHYQCTSCEYYINFGRWGEFYAREFKYCPHCGAEMKRRMKNE